MKRLLAFLLLFLTAALGHRVADYGAVRVLYQPGQEALAEAVGRRALAALAALTPPFEKPGGPLVLRLDPESDFYNGYASVFPRPGTTLFPAFPYYDGAFLNTADPLYTLVLHELVHLLHLKGPRNPLGLIPNGVARPYPAWLTEGIATYFESSGGGGRLHDAYTEGLLRALAEDPPRLAEAGVAFYPRFPYGDLRYRVGVAFVDFLIRRHGEGALFESFSRYQRTPMPLSLYLPDGYADAWKKAAGTDLEAEWRAFWESRPRVQAPPPPKGPPGRSPAVLGERLAYLHEDAIVVGKKTFPHPLGRSVGRLAWLDEETLVFDRLAPTGAGGYVRRLFTLDVETGQEKEVPGAVHAYYPAAHRGTIYYVEEGPGGSRLVALKGGRKTILHQAGPGRHLVGVAASDSGLAVLVWERGRVFPLLLGEEPRKLQAPGRILKDLAWWRETLVFASDAGGVYELYALDPATGAVEKLVSHPYGAFAPAAKGETLLYTVLTRKGFALDEGRPSPEPVDFKAALPLPAPPLSEAEPKTYAYTPLPSLAPAGWLPLAPLGALVLGVDDADEIQWLFAGVTDLTNTGVSFSVDYRPRFGLAPEHYAVSLSHLLGQTSATVQYDRSFLMGRTQGGFALRGGILHNAPAAGFSLDLRQRRSLGRDRLWGEPSEELALRLEAGYSGLFSGRLRLSALLPSGLDAGLEVGQNRMDPWFVPGVSGLAWVGLKKSLVFDHYGEDGLYYYSHFTLEPKALLLYDAVHHLGWGAALSVRGHFVYRYYLPLTPELRFGYRSDTGFWIALLP